MKKIELNIKKMHCNSCVLLIKDALLEIKGAKEAEVNLKKNNAIILFDEKITSVNELIKAIEKEGYESILK